MSRDARRQRQSFRNVVWALVTERTGILFPDEHQRVIFQDSPFMYRWPIPKVVDHLVAVTEECLRQRDPQYVSEYT